MFRSLVRLRGLHHDMKECSPMHHCEGRDPGSGCRGVHRLPNLRPLRGTKTVGADCGAIAAQATGRGRTLVRGPTNPTNHTYEPLVACQSLNGNTKTRRSDELMHHSETRECETGCKSRHRLHKPKSPGGNSEPSWHQL